MPCLNAKINQNLEMEKLIFNLEQLHNFYIISFPTFFMEIRELTHLELGKNLFGIVEDKRIKEEVKFRLEVKTVLLVEEAEEDIKIYKNFRSSINKKALLIKKFLETFRGKKIDFKLLKRKIGENFFGEIGESEIDDILDRLRREGEFIISQDNQAQIL
jgi:hypothetical protein